jgi:hypothetical protein
MAAEFLTKTFASGPTNRMTGAAFLASIDLTKKQQNGTELEEEVEPQSLRA